MSFVLAAVTVGCQSTGQIQGGVPRTSFVQKIVSLSPGTTEIIATCGNSGSLKGRTASDDYPPQVIKNVKVVASVKPDEEVIKSIAPEVIVYDSLLYSTEEIAKIKGNAQVFVFSGNTIDAFETELKNLSKIVGNETQFSGYIDRIELAKAEAKGSPVSPTPKVAVLMPSGSGADYWVGTKSFVADIVRIAGGNVVGPDADRFVPINIEMLVSQNPDIILIPVNRDRANEEVSSVLSNPKLQTVAAIKNRKIVPIDADVALRRGGRVDKFISSAYRGLAGKK